MNTINILTTMLCLALFIGACIMFLCWLANWEGDPPESHVQTSGEWLTKVENDEKRRTHEPDQAHQYDNLYP